MLMDINWLKDKKHHQQVKSVLIFLIPFALFFVPLDWMKHQHSICLFKNLTGYECYGCGMTRAILFLLHFQFKIAFNYNKLVVIVLPLLIYIWTKTIASFPRFFKFKIFKPSRRKVMVLGTSTLRQIIGLDCKKVIFSWRMAFSVIMKVNYLLLVSAIRCLLHHPQHLL